MVLLRVFGAVLAFAMKGHAARTANRLYPRQLCRDSAVGALSLDWGCVKLARVCPIFFSGIAPSSDMSQTEDT
jgi:hypothetical protein